MGRPKASDLAELATKAKEDLAKTKDLRVRKRLEVIAAVAVLAQATVAKAHNISMGILNKWVAIYRAGGLEALHDKPYTPRKEKLDECKQELLASLDSGKGPDGEEIFWTAERLCCLARERFGVEMSVSGMTAWLHRNGRTPKRPRPKHPNAATPEAQTAWKQACLDAFREGEFDVIMYEDESRLGTYTVPGILWAKVGDDLSVPVRQGRKSFHCFASVNPISGEEHHQFYERCNTEVMNLYLADLATTLNGRKCLLVVDGAGLHKAKKLVIPKGITLFFLPPYTPELNPVERLWRVSKRDCLRNRYYMCIGHIMDNLEAWFAAKSEPFYKGLCRCEFLS